MSVNLKAMPKIFVVLSGFFGAVFLYARAAEEAPRAPLYFDQA